VFFWPDAFVKGLRTEPNGLLKIPPDLTFQRDAPTSAQIESPSPDRSDFLSQVFFRITDIQNRGSQMESSLKRISLIIILYLSWLMIASSMK
jgi:hypothetical protein